MHTSHEFTRRGLIKASAVAGAAILSTRFPFATAAGATARGAGRLKVGVIGCGGRGTGAAVNILEASADTEIWAVGDAMAERTTSCLGGLRGESAIADRVNVDPSRIFNGFDAYKQVIASGVDVVILASPPGFRPIHLEAAVAGGKHVFMEKPVAVCPAGVRSVLASAAAARQKNLNVVTGTQRRHERCYTELFSRIEQGALGQITSASVFWNQGGLWMHKRKPEWSDLEWQLRNWLYFTWLSGDHIVEQHVHNLDIALWAMRTPPDRVTAMGGRQVRTSTDYGHVFDHFACEFEYADGRSVSSQCRQIDGCSTRVEEVIRGSEGYSASASGRAQIKGKNPWKWSGNQENPYVTEHKALLAGITGAGPYINEGERIAHSTLMAVMGRMSAYTGKPITWQQALESKLDLRPPADITLGAYPAGDVATPGKTPLL